MSHRTSRFLVLLLVLFSFLLPSAAGAQEKETFVVGITLVGPKDDHGWSEAEYSALESAVADLNAELEDYKIEILVFESLNPADSPEATLEGVVDSFVEEGARLIFTAADAFEEDTIVVSRKYPDIVFVNLSGDDVYTGEAPSNEGNAMSQAEWGNMLVGCAAALNTQVGHIGYLGPLINHETLRIAASAYLGAKYCYQSYAGGDPTDLQFTVTWIGFWFNIPGVTLDPTEEANRLVDAGVDVLVNGIDTTEVIVECGRRGDCLATGYEYPEACKEAPEICLGVPTMLWYAHFRETILAVMDGTWESRWDWFGPDWDNLNDETTSWAGFVPGDALTEEQLLILDDFAQNVLRPADEAGCLGIWPWDVDLQDGTPFAAADDCIDPMEFWYLDQLLEGMEGASISN